MATPSTNQGLNAEQDGLNNARRGYSLEQSKEHFDHHLSRRSLLSFEELPEWRQDNPYIHHGYRSLSHSSAQSLASWKYLHNETVNIYSHLLPAIVLLIAGSASFGLFVEHYPHSSVTDKAIFALFLLAAVFCFMSSACFHTLSNHSERVCNTSLRCDYVGIIVLLLGDFVSGIRVSFFCEPTLRIIYWTMIFVLGVATGILLLIPYFEGLKFRTLRLSAFVLTGLSAMAPIVHGIVLFGWSQLVRQSGLAYYLGEGATILIGTLAYGFRFPESRAPGRFDYWGASHQIFHVLVVLGTAFHFVGLYEAYEYNYKNRTCGLN